MKKNKERTSNYVCPFCNKKTISEWHLKQHLLKHKDNNNNPTITQYKFNQTGDTQTIKIINTENVNKVNHNNKKTILVIDTPQIRGAKWLNKYYGITNLLSRDVDELYDILSQLGIKTPELGNKGCSRFITAAITTLRANILEK